VVTTCGGVVCAAWGAAVVVITIGGVVVVDLRVKLLAIAGRKGRAICKKPSFVVVTSVVAMLGVVDATATSDVVITGTGSTDTQQDAKSLLLHASPAQKCSPSFEV